YYRKNRKELLQLIRKNALIKTRIVLQDEFENGDRKLLNFGHTLGHAIENLYGLPHGHAVAIGMNFAARVSEQVTGFSERERLVKVIRQYKLPASIGIDPAKTFDVLKMDKKRTRSQVSFVVLERIGKAVVKEIGLADIQQHLQSTK
ncbi:MAG TPA: 3-dehydroquinate synthase, partial [Chitinophagaceae bacterium]